MSGKIRQCSRCLETREIHAHDMCRGCYNRSDPERRREERRRHYLKHKDRLREKHSTYYERNRERCRAQQREYYRIRRSAFVSATHGPELVRVPVKGWGYLNAGS